MSESKNKTFRRNIVVIAIGIILIVFLCITFSRYISLSPITLSPLSQYFNVSFPVTNKLNNVSNSANLSSQHGKVLQTQPPKEVNSLSNTILAAHNNPSTILPATVTPKSGSSVVISSGPSERNVSGRTYVVSMTIWEQLMASAANFLRLQCWIKRLNTRTSISAVEPQVRRNMSRLGFYFNDHTLPVASDVFDMDTWYTQWPKNGPTLAPLTSRKEFLTEIELFHKEVILVQLQYMKKKESYECKFTWNISSLVKDLKNYSCVTISRKVCIYVGYKVPAKEFNKLVFGSEGTKNKIVIFNLWRGIGGGRIDINLPPCSINLDLYGHLKPSSSVVKDAETFANQHLGGFDQYISVSARFEKITRRYREISDDQRRKMIATKITEALQWVETHKKSVGLKHVYLAYDYGPYGSSTFADNKYYSSSDLLRKFQEDIYNGKLSFDDYKNSLRTFRFKNPGYVAMVQMTLSSRGRCLFEIGWGHCIDYVKSLFIMVHKEDSSCRSTTVWND